MNLAKPGLMISGVGCAVSRAVIVVAVILLGHWRHKPEIGQIAVIAIGIAVGLIALGAALFVVSRRQR